MTRTYLLSPLNMTVEKIFKPIKYQAQCVAYVSFKSHITIWQHKNHLLSDNLL